MPLSGILYIEENNPDCEKAASLCEDLERSGILKCKIRDITSDTDTRSYIKNRTGSSRLPLLDLRNVGMFHYNTMRIYFEDKCALVTRK